MEFHHIKLYIAITTLYCADALNSLCYIGYIYSISIRVILYGLSPFLVLSTRGATYLTQKIQ